MLKNVSDPTNKQKKKYAGPETTSTLYTEVHKPGGLLQSLTVSEM